jgi:hypothetical protein
MCCTYVAALGRQLDKQSHFCNTQSLSPRHPTLYRAIWVSGKLTLKYSESSGQLCVMTPKVGRFATVPFSQN